MAISPSNKIKQAYKKGRRWSKPKPRPRLKKGTKKAVARIKFVPRGRFKGNWGAYTAFLGRYYTYSRNRSRRAHRLALSRVLFESRVIRFFINGLLRAGLRSKAVRVFRSFLLGLSKSTVCGPKGYRSPLQAIFAAILLVSPRVLLRSKRVGGVVYRLPVFIARDKRSHSFGVRWIIQASRARKGGTMASRMVSEILDLFNKRGSAYKRKVELYNTAILNKPFVHYLKKKRRRSRLLGRLNRR